MAKPTLTSLQAEIDELRAQIAALQHKGSAPRRGRWEPSSKLQEAKAEYMRRTAAGERVKIVSGEVIAY